MQKSTHLLYILVLVLTIGFFWSCDFAFLTPDSEDQAPQTGCSNYTVWNDDGTVKEVYNCTDTLLWYEVYVKDTSGRTVTTSHYDGSSEVLLWSEQYEYDDEGRRILLQRFAGEDGVLLYSYTYAYDEDGNRAIEAYYDETDNLEWFRHSVFDADDRLILKIHYDAQWQLQWVEEHIYSGANKTRRARYDEGFVAEWAYVYTFDDQGRSLREYQYEEQAEPLSPLPVAGSKPDQSEAEANVPNSVGLVVPIPPSPVELSEPVLDPIDAVAMYLWTYDDYGFFRADFNAHHLPVRMVREDSRLPEGVDDVTVELEYYPEDESSVHSLFPMRKSAYWGDTELLVLDLSYDDVGFLSKIDASGEQVPATSFEMTYNDDLSLARIDLDLADTPVYYLKFDADPSEPGAAHPLDPTGLSGQVYSIEQYTPDDELVGTFEFDYDNEASQVRIDAVLAPDVEGETGIPNGYFLLTHDADGRTVSFESYTDEDEREWYYNYGYADVLGQAVRISEEKYDEFEDEISLFSDLLGDFGNPLELFF